MYVLEKDLHTGFGFSRGVTDCPEEQGLIPFEFLSDDGDVDKDCLHEATQSQSDSKQGQYGSGSTCKEEETGQATCDGVELLEKLCKTPSPTPAQSALLAPQEVGEMEHDSLCLSPVQNVKPAEGNTCRRHYQTQNLTNEEETSRTPQRSTVMKPNEAASYKSPSLAQLALLMMQKYEADDDEDDYTSDDHGGDDTPDPPRRTTILEPSEVVSYKSPSLQQLALLMMQKYEESDCDNDDADDEHGGGGAKQEEGKEDAQRRSCGMKPEEGNFSASSSLGRLASPMSQQQVTTDDAPPRRATFMKPAEGASYTTPSLAQLASLMMQKYEAGPCDTDDDGGDEKDEGETRDPPRRSIFMKPGEGASCKSPSLGEMSLLMMQKSEADDDDTDSEADDNEQKEEQKPLRRSQGLADRRHFQNSFLGFPGLPRASSWQNPLEVQTSNVMRTNECTSKKNEVLRSRQ